MTRLQVVGLDLSLTSTGVASIEWDEEGARASTITARIATKANGFTRLDFLVESVATWAAVADLVVVEGPSYASVGRSQHERAGLWWLVAMGLWTANRPTAVVSPGGRAKYGTGKGNAGKDDVLASVVRRYLDVPVRGNDEADALILAAMGARHLGRPIEDSLPRAHLAALDPVVWPVPGGPAFPLFEKKKE